jgi:hypothetical protein
VNSRPPTYSKAHTGGNLKKTLGACISSIREFVDVGKKMPDSTILRDADPDKLVPR